MLTDSLREFLKKPLIARMSTIDSNGYPHTVPVWFMLDGDDLVVISERKTRKTQHILANPKGAIEIGGDPADGAGYLFKGKYVVEEDPDDFWLKKITNYYEQGEQAEKDIATWEKLDMVLLRLTPEKVIKV